MSVAVVWQLGGVIVLLGCLLIIALRGYIVPKTPTLTKRYLPKTVLRWFGKSDPPNHVDMFHDDLGQETETEIEHLLQSSGIVETDPEVDDIQLTAQFHDDWWGRIRQYRSGETARKQLSTVLEVDPSKLTIDADTETSRVVVSFEGETAAHWESEAAFYADIAIEPTLREWIPQWDALHDDQRTQLIAGLRAFLETCPLCEANLEPVENVRKSCCSSDFVSMSIECTECDSPVVSRTYH